MKLFCQVCLLLLAECNARSILLVSSVMNTYNLLSYKGEQSLPQGIYCEVGEGSWKQIIPTQCSDKQEHRGWTLSSIWGFREGLLEELMPKLNLKRLASLSKGTEA